MERTAFTLLHDAESSWWYRGRAKAVAALTRRAKLARGEAVLDFGAGYGGMRSLLSSVGSPVFAFEPDGDARGEASKRGYAQTYSTEADAFTRQYSAIGLFDVVEHIEDDAAFLSRAHNVLLENGHLLISVPAFPFLWSTHDVTHHHYRRYTRKTLRELLAREGYVIEAMSYWNMSLFIPAALVRLLGFSGESGLALPKPLDALFTFIVSVEAFLLRFIPLPFGTGLIAVARKV